MWISIRLPFVLRKKNEGKEKKTRKKILFIVWFEIKFRRKESRRKVRENMTYYFLSLFLYSTLHKMRVNVI